MGSNPQADVPGNNYHQTIPSLASRASNAADQVLPILGPGQAIQILAANFVPLTSQAGSATDYADVKIINMSADGTGVVVLASKSFSAVAASVAALGQGSMTLAATPTKTSAHRLGLSYTKNGNGIPLVAHGLELSFRYI